MIEGTWNKSIKIYQREDNKIRIGSVKVKKIKKIFKKRTFDRIIIT